MILLALCKKNLIGVVQRENHMGKCAASWNNLVCRAPAKRETAE